MKFLEILEAVLLQNQAFISEDGRVLKPKVYDAAMQMDADLLRLLAGEEQLKQHFFTEVDGMLIFDKVKFAWVLESREFLPDSYTMYKNKIGLADSGGQLISQKNDVALVWPYKECVLEGGQTKEDQKRDEIFYNEILAPDEVTRLLYPKVFTKAKRYTVQGEESITEFSDADNLIIKGNNLLALSSLLKRYEDKIKCIYIDPPYFFDVKKDEDTFAYNSNFKLSTWLVFMKNRLKIAKRLLRDDGAIFVQISDDGVAELHRLLKDIFCPNGENNFINKITVKTKSPSGFASVNPGVFETAEYILAFAKNKRQWSYNPQYVKSDFDANYKWFISNKVDEPSQWQIIDLFEHVASEQGFASKKKAIEKLGDGAFFDIVGRFALENADSVFRYTAIGNNAGQNVVEAREKSKKRRNKIFVVERDRHYHVCVLNGQEMAFYSKKIREIDGRRVPSIQLSNIWMDTPYEGIAKEGGVTLKGGKKPEKLIRRIIEMSTNQEDIVLDFCLGSGTTCAVAHKLGRRYIGIEQLDYGVNDSVIRLWNVLAGDSTGISKAVNWQGGGSFVYCELAERNEALLQKLQEADSSENVQEILDYATDNGLLRPSVLPADLYSSKDEFAELTLGEQKQLVMELIDKNKLYINLCDMEDTMMEVSEKDKAFNRSFYCLG